MSLPIENNPYVFIVGCPRSGTTLLRRMLDAHSDLAILETEQHWIVRYYLRKKNLTSDARLTPAFLDKLYEHEKFLKLSIPRSEVSVFEQNCHYRQFIQRLFQFYAAMHNKRYAGDKTPENARYIGVLADLFPQAKFVHIIRDGRDVALSVAGWEKNEKLKCDFSTWNEHPLETSAFWWSAYVRSAREAGFRLPPGQYYEIRYEELVENPMKEMDKLCAFLALPFDQKMIHFYSGKKQKGKDAKHAWLPVTSGLRDWQSQMPSKDRQLFQACSGELLSQLGYIVESHFREHPYNHIFDLKRRFEQDFQRLQFGETVSC